MQSVHIGHRLRQENEQLRSSARDTRKQVSAAQQAEPTPDNQPDQDAHACVPSHADQPEPHLEERDVCSRPAAPQAAAAALATAPDAAEPVAAGAAAAEGDAPALLSSSTAAPTGLACSSSAAIRDVPVATHGPTSPAGEPSVMQEPSSANAQQPGAYDAVMLDAKAAAGEVPGDSNTASRGEEPVTQAEAGDTDASLPLGGCSQGGDAALEEAHVSTSELQWEAPGELELEEAQCMQKDCLAADLPASQIDCEQMSDGSEQADRAVGEAAGLGRQPDQAIDVHATALEPVQAAEELHAKLGSVVSLVSAVCGSFSPHDTVGALLHNLQVHVLSHGLKHTSASNSSPALEGVS